MTISDWIVARLSPAEGRPRGNIALQIGSQSDKTGRALGWYLRRSFWEKKFLTPVVSLAPRCYVPKLSGHSPEASLPVESMQHQRAVGSLRPGNLSVER